MAELGPLRPTSLAILRSFSPAFAIAGMSNDTDTVSTKEAAALLGISPDRVRTMVRSGELVGYTHQGNVRISRESVEAILHPTGTPAESVAVELMVLEQILGCPVNELGMMLEPERVSEILGCSVEQARKSLACGDIPAVKIGSRYKSPTPAFVAWLMRVNRQAA